MMMQLAFASAETIARRNVLMATGTCSPAEYSRMVSEKCAAMQAAALAMMTGGSHAAIVSPFLTRARSNARRLRRKA